MKYESGIQDFYTLRKQCLDSGKLFEDPEFPATNKSLFYSAQTEPAHYEWKRPKDICGGKTQPKFSIESFSRFDVVQGELGDCWFLAAIANLTENEQLLSRVICKDNSFDENYAGIFHFR